MSTPASAVLTEAIDRLAPAALELLGHAIQAIAGGQRKSAARLAAEAADVQATRLAADAMLLGAAALKGEP